MSTGNCFYSNIIEYGTDWGAHNNHPQNPKYLNNRGQIIAPFPGTARPNLFLFSKQQTTNYHLTCKTNHVIMFNHGPPTYIRSVMTSSMTSYWIGLV